MKFIGEVKKNKKNNNGVRSNKIESSLFDLSITEALQPLHVNTLSVVQQARFTRVHILTVQSPNLL